MKKPLLLFSGILSLTFSINFTFAQTPYLPPDKDGETPSNAMVYIHNQGQLLDNTNAIRNDVKYYMPNATPAIYAMEDRVSLVVLELDSIPNDTITHDSATSYRIDMRFLVEGSAQTIAPTPVEQVSQYYNYYLSHLTGGSLTNVAAYDRIVYEDVWTGIDVHLTTNLIAPKMYFVVHPNADPDDISLGFTGQDDIDILSSGELEFDLNNQVIHLPELEAYEVDASTNQVNSLAWHPDWENPNNGNVVTVTTGNYDTDNYLVLVASKKVGALAANTPNPTLLDWSTYAGTQAQDMYNDLEHDPNSNNDVVATGSTGNINFAQQAGVGLTHTNGVDGVFTKFDADGKLLWVAYYGTTGIDYIENVAIKSTGDIFFSAVVSPSGTPVLEPSGGNFNITTQYGASKTSQFVLGALRNDGQLLKWATYFGNDNDANEESHINDMIFDNTGVLYLVGQTRQGSGNTSFPITSRSGTNVYNQSTFGGGITDDGFIARFENNLDLNWLTYFGGSGRDIISSITINPNNDIFFAGYTASSQPTYPTHCAAPTTTGQFPVCNTANGNTVLRSFLYQGGVYDGFIAQILANGQLNWSRYMGGSELDMLEVVTCNNTDDNTKPYYISVGGNTFSPNIELDCDLTNQDIKFCKNVIGWHVNVPPPVYAEIFITKFDASFDISYATYLGGVYREDLMGLKANENNDLVGFAHSNSWRTGYSFAECSGYIQGGSGGGNYNSIPTCPSGPHGITPDPYAYPNSGNLPSIPAHGNGLYRMYVEFANSNHQGYLFQINNDERMIWASKFATSPARYIPVYGLSNHGGMTLTSNGDLYIAQKEAGNLFPIYKPNNNAYTIGHQGGLDAFVSKFDNFTNRINWIASSMQQIEPTGGELQLFPNPSGSSSTIKWKGETIERYSIYDIGGKLIETDESNSNEVEIDVTNKSQGIYFIKAETKNKIETKKLIVK